LMLVAISRKKLQMSFMQKYERDSDHVSPGGTLGKITTDI